MTDPTRLAHGRKPQRSGVVVPSQPRWFERIGAAVLVGSIRLLSLTIRWRVTDHSGLSQESGQPEQAIFCLWHNRLALSMPIYRQYSKRYPKAKRLAALVSASRDGGLLACCLKLSGVRPVRGSTSRRGRQALLELATAAADGFFLAITPDGPRGPRYIVQPGVISLAQVTGLAIVPASYHLNWKYCLKSWDGFQVPLPFARCCLELGEALRVPRDASDVEHERLRLELERHLREMTRD